MRVYDVGAALVLLFVSYPYLLGARPTGSEVENPERNTRAEARLMVSTWTSMMFCRVIITDVGFVDHSQFEKASTQHMI